MSSTMLHTPADAQLLARFCDRRDVDAFEQLVTRHARLVFSVCRSVLGRHHDAEDAAQAAFITLARRASSLKRHPSIAGWLHRVAWHIATRARAARQLRDRRERAAAGASIDLQFDPGADDSTARIVHAALAAMPEKYRLPIVLHHLEGWTEQETAEVLGCRLGTLSGRLSRGRKLLGRKLEQRGGGGAGMATIPAIAGAMTEESIPAAFASHSAAVVKSGTASAQVLGLCHAALTRLARDKLRLAVLALAVTTAAVTTAALIAKPLLARRSTTGQVLNESAMHPGWIQGRASDMSGQPAVGARIEIYRSAQDAEDEINAIATIFSGADGLFAVERLPLSNYHLVVTCYEPAASPGQAFQTNVRSSGILHVVIHVARR